MDCDDGDFRSHNFHLITEDYIRFPSNLHLYALPKFELDDNIQVHLGFGLDETEALLGMQSQPDTHWIEDFSRGSSGIEFSSSAAESCSISRRNNVWSEATSSESVEMLLKCVGQDEVITRQISVQELDVPDGLDGVNNKMNPSHHEVQNFHCAVGEVLDNGLIIQSDKCSEGMRVPVDNSAMNCYQVVNIPTIHEVKDSDSDNMINDEQAAPMMSDLETSNIASSDTVVNDGPKCSSTESENTVTHEDPGFDALVKVQNGPFTRYSATFDSSANRSRMNLEELNKSCSEILGPEKISDILEDDGELKSPVLNSDASIHYGTNFESNGSNKFKLNLKDSNKSCGGVLDPEKNDDIAEDDDKDKSLFLNNEVIINEELVVEAENAVSANQTSPEKDSKDRLKLDDKSICKCQVYGSFSGGVFTSSKDLTTSVLVKVQNGPFAMSQEDSDAKANKFTQASEDSCCDDSLEKNNDSGKGPTLCKDRTTNNGENKSFVLECVISSANDDTDGHFTGNIEAPFFAGNHIHEVDPSVEVPKGTTNEDPRDTENSGSEKQVNEALSVVTEDKTFDDEIIREEKGHLSLSHVMVCCQGKDTGNMEESSFFSLECQLLPVNTNAGSHFSENIEMPSIVGDHSYGVCPIDDVPGIESSEKLLKAESSANVKREQEVTALVMEVETFEASGVCCTPTITKVQQISSSCSKSEDRIQDMQNVSPKHCIEDESAVPAELVSGDDTMLSSQYEKEVGHPISSENRLVMDIINEEREAEMSCLPISDDSSSGEEELDVVISVGSSRMVPGPLPNPEQHTVCNKVVEPHSGAVTQLSTSVAESANTEDHRCSTDVLISLSVSKQQTVSNIVAKFSSCPVTPSSAAPVHSTYMTDLAADLNIHSSEAQKDTAMSTAAEGTGSSPTHSICEAFGSSECLPDSTHHPKESICWSGSNDRELVCAGEQGKCEEMAGNCVAEDLTKAKNPEAVQASNYIELSCQSPVVINSRDNACDDDHNKDDGRANLDIPAAGDSYSVSPDADRHPNISLSPLSDASGNGTSFTFMACPLVSLSMKDTDVAWRPFSSDQSFEMLQTHAAALGLNQTACHEGQSVQKHNSQKINDGLDMVVNGEKNTAVSDALLKETSPRRKSVTFSGKQKPEQLGKVCSQVPCSLGPGCEGMQVEEMQLHLDAVESNEKLSVIPTAQASNLPDLNSSISSVLFNQPFTDSQQVQLRAQIFVYGSLIQGTAPDEACMISAFGDSTRDSGKSLWETSWRIAVERSHNQRSPSGSIETPLSTCSGADVSDQALRTDLLPGRTVKTPVGQSGRRVGMPSPSLYPNMSFSSPLWSVTIPSRGALQSDMPRCSILENPNSLSSLNPYHSSQMKQYIGSSSPWLSQSSATGIPWIVSPQNVNVDMGQYSMQSITEAAHVTPVRDGSATRFPSVQLAPHSTLTPIGGAAHVLPCPMISMEVERVMSSSDKLAAAENKLRKRKKTVSPSELAYLPVSQSRTEHHAMSAGFKSPHTATSKVSNSSSVACSAPSTSAYLQVIGGGTSTHERIALLDEASDKVEQSKAQAEDAAAFASAAVRNCQGVWNELSMQKKTGLVTDVEANLASASVAAAAAAAVAKAAAMAAKVAADASFQAKQMADDALGTDLFRCSDCALSDRGSAGMTTPASLVKGKEKAHTSSSVITAAREVTRKRVEAASAAAKRAENLDAVLRAAEIAAEAVAQAGTIIAMGDPVPLKLRELLQSGPDSYWKQQKVFDEHNEEHNIGTATVCLEKPASDICNDGTSGKKCSSRMSERKQPSFKSVSIPPEERLEALMSLHQDSNKKGLEVQEGCKHPASARTIDIVPESGTESVIAAVLPQNDQPTKNLHSGRSKQNNITEGSIIEVMSEGNGLRGSWFSAKVISVEEGKAFVCYDELRHDEGRGPLKEWVSLETEDGKIPKVRLAHPLTGALKYEGTRKRRRAAMGSYMWSVGDRVDVWMHDGWQEAIITGMDKDDDTKVTVQLPGGNSSVINTWNLRPSLVWRTGQWIEWSRESSCIINEGDMPQEKRQKLAGKEGVFEPRAGEKNKEVFVKNLHVELTRQPEENISQMLSVKDKVFSVGKNAGKEKNSEAHRVRRTGLQKEGSKVVIGVPKPGKKRKFIEVSKHYVADRTSIQTSEGTDPVKVARSLIPQRSSNSWRAASKIDARSKQPLEPKSKLLRPLKPQVTQGRIPAAKENLSAAASQDSLPYAKSSLNHVESIYGRQNIVEGGSSSSTKKASEPSDSLASSSSASKKKPFSSSETDKGAKGKVVPPNGRSMRDEAKLSEGDSSAKVLDSTEPRRSNRRIQPTSRLLEGLQSSSLVVSKMPHVSQEKVSKIRQRNPSRGESSSNANVSMTLVPPQIRVPPHHSIINKDNYSDAFADYLTCKRIDTAMIENLNYILFGRSNT